MTQTATGLLAPANDRPLEHVPLDDDPISLDRIIG